MPGPRSARGWLRALPPGMLGVGIGLGVLGLSSYGFLAICAHVLHPAAFAGLSVLYVIAYTFGPGAFLPFEQEIARALSERRARGQGGGPLLRRALLLSTAVTIVLLVLALALHAPLTRELFDGSDVLFAGLLISIVGLAAAYVGRGIFAGNGQFGAYGAQLAAEGGTRFVACVVLVACGVRSVGGYGLVLGAAFVAAVLITAAPLRRTPRGGPDAPWSEFTGRIGWLIVGAVLSLGLVNAGPVAVKLLAHGDKTAAGQLLAGLLLARLPLFLFAAVQAALLPSLAADLAAGDTGKFVAGVRRLVLTVAGLSGVMTLALAAIGPPVMHVLFGAGFRLGRLDLVLLSTATGIYMVATVLSNGLLALKRFGLAALGWTVGVAVFAAVIALHLSLYARLEYSFLAAVVVAAAVFAVLVRAATQSFRAGPPGLVPLTEVVPGP